MHLLLLLFGAWASAAEPAPTAVADAWAVSDALARVQNDWAAHTLQSDIAPCSHGEARTLVTRARLFGTDLHSRLVTLQAQQPEHPDLAGLTERYRAAVAFQAKIIEPRAGDCALPLSIAPGVGPQPPADTPVAIVALMGVVCPGLEPGDGSVMVVRGPVCAQSFGACECRPRRVLPGEVLGP